MKNTNKSLDKDKLKLIIDTYSPEELFSILLPNPNRKKKAVVQSRPRNILNQISR